MINKPMKKIERRGQIERAVGRLRATKAIAKGAGAATAKAVRPYQDLAMMKPLRSKKK